jgi:hypothetical protein
MFIIVSGLIINDLEAVILILSLSDDYKKCEAG